MKGFDASVHYFRTASHDSESTYVVDACDVFLPCKCDVCGEEGRNKEAIDEGELVVSRSLSLGQSGFSGVIGPSFPRRFLLGIGADCNTCGSSRIRHSSGGPGQFGIGSSRYARNVLIAEDQADCSLAKGVGREAT